MEKSDRKGLASLFSELATLHEKHADELGAILARRGRTADKDGSFMSLVHETIMDRPRVGWRLRRKRLPGLIDGEKRNMSKYDEALKAPADNSNRPDVRPPAGRARSDGGKDDWDEVVIVVTGR